MVSSSVSATSRSIPRVRSSPSSATRTGPDEDFAATINQWSDGISPWEFNVPVEDYLQPVDRLLLHRPRHLPARPDGLLQGHPARRRRRSLQRARPERRSAVDHLRLRRAPRSFSRRPSRSATWALWTASFSWATRRRWVPIPSRPPTRSSIFNACFPGGRIPQAGVPGDGARPTSPSTCRATRST